VHGADSLTSRDYVCISRRVVRDSTIQKLGKGQTTGVCTTTKSAIKLFASKNYKASNLAVESTI